MTLTQGHLNIKIKIMVFSEITGFGNYCSLRPETLQMQMKSIKVCEYSRSRSFHDDLILQASGERSQDQWSSGYSVEFVFLSSDLFICTGQGRCQLLP